MSIDKTKLIFAPMLQDPLIGRQADLLANGTVSFFKDSSHGTKKAVYYQSGSTAPYEDYLALPNPMTLSASGTMVDENGNDIIPGWYPFASDNKTREAYYISVKDANGTVVFSRYNFPIDTSASPGGASGVDTKQLIKNNRFWRNYSAGITNGKIPLTAISTIVCPDQHDGFSTITAGPAAGSTAPIVGSLMSDITFNKNVLSATETAQFSQFALTGEPQLQGDIQPEYYLNHVCTAAGTGETLKYYQFPISLHLRTLSEQNAVITIQAIDNLNSGKQISLSLFAFQGYGQTSTTPTPFATEALSGSWTKYPFEVTLPSDLGTNVDAGPGDDALYLWVGMPTNVTCDISFAIPSVYLVSTIQEAPTNDFSSYDEVNSIISSPRTGDIRVSVNSVYPAGWVPMNNGTIGNLSSNGTAFADNSTWPLYSLLWNMFKPYGATVFPIYRSTGELSTYSSTILTDWNGNKAIALTQLMGQVIMGTVPQAALLTPTTRVAGYTSPFTGSGSTITISSNNVMNLYNGAVVTFSGTSTLSTSTVYYAGQVTTASSIPTSVTILKVYTSFANAITNTSPASVDATGTILYGFVGTTTGEYAHIQGIDELAAHTHPPLSPATNFASSNSGGPVGSTAGTNLLFENTTGSTGNSDPFNVTQPATLMNMFIKL